MATKLAIICPCYNEEEIIEKSAKTLVALIDGLVQNNKLDQSSTVVFVNDGSFDST